jgi:bifunctional non-homologous end joining protein LigD
MTERADTEARPLLPQFARRQEAIVSNIDWVVEPCWKGERLLARLRNGRVELTDERGAPASDTVREAAVALEAAIDANQALVDGSWTALPFVGEGSRAREWAKMLDKEGGEESADPERLERRRAFVTWDLIELDGEPLHDVPYQERRRLLESVIVEGPQVRVSTAVRHPFEGWVGAWRANGFTHFVAKQINSRYRHGETSDDWLQVPTSSDGRPSILTILFGGGRRKARRIIGPEGAGGVRSS